MIVRIGVAVMAVLLVLYIVLVGGRAWVLLTSGEPTLIAMGVAIIIVPVLAVWGLGRELWFGWRSQQLGKRLEAEGRTPKEEVAIRPSGRPDREQAAALFPAYAKDVDRHPEDWAAWYRLGLVYDAAGDRRRARDAIRRAIRLEGDTRD